MRIRLRTREPGVEGVEKALRSLGYAVEVDPALDRSRTIEIDDGSTTVEGFLDAVALALDARWRITTGGAVRIEARKSTQSGR